MTKGRFSLAFLYKVLCSLTAVVSQKQFIVVFYSSLAFDQNSLLNTETGKDAEGSEKGSSGAANQEEADRKSLKPEEEAAQESCADDQPQDTGQCSTLGCVLNLSRNQRFSNLTTFFQETDSAWN